MHTLQYTDSITYPLNTDTLRNPPSTHPLNIPSQLTHSSLYRRCSCYSQAFKNPQPGCDIVVWLAGLHFFWHQQHEPFCDAHFEGNQLLPEGFVPTRLLLPKHHQHLHQQRYPPPPPLIHHLTLSHTLPNTLRYTITHTRTLSFTIF